MHSFFRASHRISSQKLVRSFSMKTNNAVGTLNLNIVPHTQSKVVSNMRIFEGRWDQSQKHMMLGLGCSVYIDLCAEAMFFKKVPLSVYKESLELVASNEHVQARIGANVCRKGNKFGVWPGREAGGKKVLTAHYYVQGDKGDAKVVLKVEKQHLEYQTILLFVEFSNSERLVLVEVEEEDPQPSILPSL